MFPPTVVPCLGLAFPTESEPGSHHPLPPAPSQLASLLPLHSPDLQLTGLVCLPHRSVVLDPLLLTPRTSFRLTLGCELPLLSHHGLPKSSSLFRTWPQVPFLWTASPGSYHNQSLLTSYAGDNYTNMNSPSLVTFSLHSTPVRSAPGLCPCCR